MGRRAVSSVESRRSICFVVPIEFHCTQLCETVKHHIFLCPAFTVIRKALLPKPDKISAVYVSLLILDIRAEMTGSTTIASFYKVHTV